MELPKLSGECICGHERIEHTRDGCELCPCSRPRGLAVSAEGEEDVDTRRRRPR